MRKSKILRNRNSVSEYPEAKSKWTYKAFPTLADALTGADFVFISILLFREVASDVHKPEAYGIFQAVGDTIGPGGLVRALRTIPMYVEITLAIDVTHRTRGCSST